MADHLGGTRAEVEQKQRGRPVPPVKRLPEDPSKQTNKQANTRTSTTRGGQRGAAVRPSHTSTIPGALRV